MADNTVSITGVASNGRAGPFARPSSATYFDASGVLQTADVDIERFGYDPVSLNYLGPLLETASTNLVRNARCEGSVAGSPGTLPTNWSLPNVSGLVRQIVGSGVENGIPYVDIRYSGTSNAAFWQIYTEATTVAIPVSPGQQWTSSLYMRLVGGSFTNCTVFMVQQIYFTSAGAAIFTGGSTTDSASFPTSAPLNTQRYSVTTFATNATIAYTSGASIRVNFPTSSAIDFTIRFGAPQCELIGNTPTNYSGLFGGGWANGQCVQTNFQPDPAGTSRAVLVTDNAVSGNHTLTYVSGTLANNQQLTYSLYAKDGGRRYLRFQIFDSASSGNQLNATFDTVAGTITQAGTGAGLATGVSATITAVGNGWYRCTVTGTLSTNVDTTVTIRLFLYNTSTNGNYVGGAGAGLYLWGSQLEIGGTASPYISTEASSTILPIAGSPAVSSRAADMLSSMKEIDAAPLGVSATCTANTFAIGWSISGVSATSSTNVLTTARSITGVLATGSANSFATGRPTSASALAQVGTSVAQTSISVFSFTRASSATYVDNVSVLQTVGSNVLRVQGGVPLLEAAGVNTCPYPETIGFTGWLVSFMSVFPGFDAPNGTATATRMYDTTASNNHYLSVNISGGLPANNYATVSIFAQAYTSSSLRLQMDAGTYAQFDLTGGIVTALAGIGLKSASMQALSGGWYRCSFTFFRSLQTTVAVCMQPGIYVGNGTDAIQVWGLQSEPGQATTSYMVGGSRAADAYSTSSATVGNTIATAPTGVSGLVAASGTNSFSMTWTIPCLGVAANGSANSLATGRTIGGVTATSGANSLTGAWWSIDGVRALGETTDLGGDPYSRASSATYFDATGTLQTVGNDVLRLAYDPASLNFLGPLIEPAGTNYTRNPRAEGAVVGTTTMPTFWSWSTLSGLARQVMATGIEDGIPYVDIRIWGTSTSTFVHILTDATTGIPAASGQQWTTSIYARLVAGSTAGWVNFILLQYFNNSSGATIVNGGTGGDPATWPTNAPLRTQRYSNTSIPLNSGIVYTAGCGVRINVINGSAIDFTIRFGAPQAELISTTPLNLFSPVGGWWSLSNASVTNFQPDMLGTMRAVFVTDNATLSTHYYTLASPTTPANQLATTSVYVSDAGRRYLRLQMYDTSLTGNSVAATFDVVAGTIAAAPIPSGAATNISGGIIPMGNGWFRCWVSCQLQAGIGTTTTARLYLYPTGGPNVNYADGTGLGLYFFRPQLQVGPLTDYISNEASSNILPPVGSPSVSRRATDLLGQYLNLGPQIVGVGATGQAGESRWINLTGVFTSAQAGTLIIVAAMAGAAGTGLATPLVGAAFSRASSATYFDSALTLQTIGNDSLRPAYDPVLGTPYSLIEPAGTNWVRNPRGEGGVNGTTTMPTNWSMSNTGGVIPTVVGTGTEDGIPYVDMRWNGTTTGAFGLQFEATNGVPATMGQQWIISVYIRLIAGTLSSSLFNVGVYYYNSSRTFVTGTNQNIANLPTSAPLRTQRYGGVSVVTIASTAYMSGPRIGLSPTVGPIDFTLRLGLPQAELLGPTSINYLPPILGGWVGQQNVQQLFQPDPFGQSRAMLVMDNPVSGTHYVNATTVALANNQSNTFSVYVKDAGRQFIVLQMLGNPNCQVAVIFDLLAGTMLAGSTPQIGTQSILDGYSIAPVPSVLGWYRLSLSATISTTVDTTITCRIYMSNSIGNYTGSYTGNGTGFYLYGPQCQAGPLTPYISTEPTSAMLPLAGSPAVSSRATDVTGQYYAVSPQPIGVSASALAGAIPLQLPIIGVGCFAQIGSVTSLPLKTPLLPSVAATAGAGVLAGGSFSRVTPATYFDATGVLQSAAINVVRPGYDPVTLNYYGPMIEAASANWTRNPTCSGAIPGTSTLPTNWSISSASNLSRTVIGSGIEDGIPYVDLQVSGTSNSTIYNILTDLTSAAIPAMSGQQWATSVNLRLVGGSTANWTSCSLMQYFQNSAGGSLVNMGSTGDAAPFPTNAPLRTQRWIGGGVPVNNGIVWTSGCGIRIQIVSGAAIDFTLRIGAPQTELLSSNGFNLIPPLGTNWTTPNCVITTFQPDMLGTSRAIFVTESTAAGSHYFLAVSAATPANQQVTFSIYVKDGGRRYIRLNPYDNSSSGNQFGITFDVVAGTITQVPTAFGAATNVTGGIIPASNGWYRVWVSGVFQTGVGGVSVFRLYLYNTGTSGSYTDGISGLGLYLFRPQMQAGPLTDFISNEPTSIILPFDQSSAPYLRGTDVTGQTISITEPLTGVAASGQPGQIPVNWTLASVQMAGQIGTVTVPSIQPLTGVATSGAAQNMDGAQFLRASPALYFDAAGTLQTAGVNVKRPGYDPVTLKSYGSLIEAGSINWVRNARCEGSAAGNPGILPTNFTITSMPVGLSRQVMGSGVEDGIPYFDLRIFGSPSSTIWHMITETNTGIPAADGQQWSVSTFARLVGGTTSGWTWFLLSGYFNDANGTTVSNLAITSFDAASYPSNAPLRTQRYTNSSVAYNGTVYFSGCGIRVNMTTGSAVDFTLRIGAVQAELLATNPINICPQVGGSWLNNFVNTTSFQPDMAGTSKAVFVTDSAASNVHFYATTTVNGMLPTSSPTTASVFVKDAGRRFLRLIFYSAQITGNNVSVTFDIQAGTVAATPTLGGSSTNPSAGIIPAGNGWYRCWVTVTLNTADNNVLFRLYLNQAYNVSSYLDAIGLGFYFVNPQLQSGALTDFISTDATGPILPAANLPLISVRAADLVGQYIQNTEPLTGVSATGFAGQLPLPVQWLLAGVQTTTQRGTLLATQTVGLTGNLTSSQLGVMSFPSTRFLTGLQSTTQVAGLVAQRSMPIIGVGATGQIGLAQTSAPRFAVGVQSVAQVNNDPNNTLQSVRPIGVQAVGQRGIPLFQAPSNIIGVETSLLLGNVLFRVSPSFAGVSTAANVGSLSKQTTLTLSGVGAASNLGLLTAPQVVSVAGVGGTGQCGGVAFQGFIVLPNVSASTAVGTLSQTLVKSVTLTGVKTTGAAGAPVGTSAFGVLLPAVIASGQAGRAGRGLTVGISGVGATGQAQDFQFTLLYTTQVGAELVIIGAPDLIATQVGSEVAYSLVPALVATQVGVEIVFISSRNQVSVTVIT